MNPYLALAALIAVAAAGWAGYSHGVENTTNKWKARENAVAAQHSADVTKAEQAARKDEREQAAKRAAAETALADKNEARVAPRQAKVAATLRAQRDAENADETFARCLALPLPDGLRVEPAPAGPGSPTG